jgi:hypothetical protein
MPMSDYVASIRSRIGTDLLLLPGVTAVIRDGDRFLLARFDPAADLAEERVRIRGIVGVYGGRPMMMTYPNGDNVGYVTTAYDCELLSDATPDLDELLELGWFDRDAIPALPHRDWIDRVIDDAPGRSIFPEE